MAAIILDNVVLLVLEAGLLVVIRAETRTVSLLPLERNLVIKENTISHRDIVRHENGFLETVFISVRHSTENLIEVIEGLKVAV